MEKMRLGRTNLNITRLGWGSIPLQRANDEEALDVVKAVIDMGVDFIDTARAYTTSEKRIGLVLEKSKKPMVISSKSMVRTEKIYDDVLTSIENLKVKKINIYNFHNVSNINDYNTIMSAGGGYNGLKRAKKEGLIDHIGITSHNLKILEQAIEDNFFDVIMTCYSFLEPDSAERIFPKAREKDIGIIAMKSFSGGVIEEAGPALRYVLQAKDILLIPGSETVEKAKKNWKIFTGSREITKEDIEYIELLKKRTEKVFCRRCDYCLPCSEGISIQYAVGLKQAYNRFGPGAKWLLESFDKARNCTGCGQCAERCPYSLPIPDLIKENLSWLDEQLKNLK